MTDPNPDVRREIPQAPSPFADWDLHHSYVAKAAPRPGIGWDIRVFAYDDDAPDQARLVGMTDCATLAQLETKAWDFVRTKSHALVSSWARVAQSVIPTSLA